MIITTNSGKITVPAFYLGENGFHLGRDSDRYLVNREEENYFTVSDSSTKEYYKIAVQEVNSEDDEIWFKNPISGDKGWRIASFSEDDDLDGSSDGNFLIGDMHIKMDIKDMDQNTAIINFLTYSDVSLYTQGRDTFRIRDGGEYFIISNPDTKDSYLMRIYKLFRDKQRISFQDIGSGRRDWIINYASDDNLDGSSDGNFLIEDTFVNIDVNDRADEFIGINLDMNGDNSFHDEDIPIYTARGSSVKLHTIADGYSADEIVITEPIKTGCGEIVINLEFDSQGNIIFDKAERKGAPIEYSRRYK